MRIAIFGGDKRMLFAARAFSEEGHTVYVAGFDHLTSLCDIRVCGYEEAARRCEIAVLPVRPLEGDFLSAPFSLQKIGAAELITLLGKKPIFSGSAEQLRQYASGTVQDYAAEETFTLKNAELTAEAAVGILIREYEGAVCGADVLVTGYGRIGKVLSAYLRSMGANVTVAARRQSDRELIVRSGMKAADYPSVDFGAYRVIINTVPAVVLDKRAIGMMRDDVFIVDLASAPGGTDRRSAEERNLSLLHALSLPGKTAPLAAGTIIKDTVMLMLSRKSSG